MRGDIHLQIYYSQKRKAKDDWLKSQTIIPSIISMFRLGFKQYCEQLVLLKNLYKRLSTGYKLTYNQVYTYSNGSSSSTYTQPDTNYYFPLIVNKDNILVVSKKKGPFNTINIQYCKLVNDNWENNVVDIKTSSCLFTQILNDRFQKKIDRLMPDSIVIDNIDNLNELLNSEITSLKREDKLKKLLNE